MHCVASPCHQLNTTTSTTSICLTHEINAALFACISSSSRLHVPAHVSPRLFIKPRCVAASLVFALLGGNGVLWASIYSPNSLTEDAATPAKVDGNAVFAWTARRGEPNDGTTQGDDGKVLLGVAWLDGWLVGWVVNWMYCCFSLWLVGDWLIAWLFDLLYGCWLAD